MRDRGANAAVLEVDTEAQATGSLQWVQPTISVFTNLGDDPSSMFSSKEVSASSSCSAFSRRTAASIALPDDSCAARYLLGVNSAWLDAVVTLVPPIQGDGHLNLLHRVRAWRSA